MEEELNIKTKDNQTDDAAINLWVLLRNFICGCLKFWWLAVLLAFLGAAATVILSYRSYTPRYRSQATFTVTTSVGDNSNEGYTFYYDSARADQLELTFPYILSSQLLTDAMKEDMGVEVINGTVSATSIPNSNMVTMRAESSNPNDAKAILESAIRVYPSVSRFVIGETKFNMIDVPNMPNEPFNTPSYKRRSVEGAAVGLIIGVIFVALYALLRKTILNTEELERVINIPCFASLPKIKQAVHKNQKVLYPSVLSRKISPWFSENMETLRLRVTKEMESNGQKVLLVTSTVSGEGKSLIASNLAYKLAKRDKRVLLVDADLRKQNLAKNIGIQNNRGIDVIISGKYSAMEAVTFDEKSGIFFLGGNAPLTRTSHIFLHGLKDIINELKNNFDYVVLDASPSGEFEDVFLMEEYADAVLYVVKHDFAPKSKITEAMASLESESMTVIGYVFNGVSSALGSYGYYGYGKYGYGKYGYGKYGYGKYGRYGYGYGRKENESE